MPTEQAVAEKPVVAEEAKPEDKVTSETDSGWVIRRPKRAKVTAEEAIKWTEDFAATRKERFIASIRRSKG